MCGRRSGDPQGDKKKKKISKALVDGVAQTQSRSEGQEVTILVFLSACLGIGAAESREKRWQVIRFEGRGRKPATGLFVDWGELRHAAAAGVCRHQLEQSTWRCHI